MVLGRSAIVGGGLKTIRRCIHKHRSYYDALGISPNATQADIKSAFYKLSMQYHPDKTTGDASKFREISTAYEVLGNIKLRKLYDTGELPTSGGSVDRSQYDQRRWDGGFSAHSSHSTYAERESKKGATYGKTEFYNFDEWTKQHYSEAFQRKRDNKKRAEEWAYRVKRQQEFNRKQQFVSRVCLGMISFAVIMSVVENFYNQWDKPKKSVGR